MKLNSNVYRIAELKQKQKPKKLKFLRKKLLKQYPWKQWDSQSDGQSNINQNLFGPYVSNEQIRKDTNLTGRTDDASELYYSILVDPGY